MNTFLCLHSFVSFSHHINNRGKNMFEVCYKNPQRALQCTENPTSLSRQHSEMRAHMEKVTTKSCVVCAYFSWFPTNLPDYLQINVHTIYCEFLVVIIRFYEVPMANDTVLRRCKLFFLEFTCFLVDDRLYSASNSMHPTLPSLLIFWKRMAATPWTSRNTTTPARHPNLC